LDIVILQVFLFGFRNHVDLTIVYFIKLFHLCKLMRKLLTSLDSIQYLWLYQWNINFGKIVKVDLSSNSTVSNLKNKSRKCHKRMDLFWPNRLVHYVLYKLLDIVVYRFLSIYKQLLLQLWLNPWKISPLKIRKKVR
jgi:hypothetical protein